MVEKVSLMSRLRPSKGISILQCVRSFAPSATVSDSHFIYGIPEFVKSGKGGIKRNQSVGEVVRNLNVFQRVQAGKGDLGNVDATAENRTDLANGIDSFVDRIVRC